MSTSQVESLIEGGTGPGGGGRRALAHNINSNFNKKHPKHDGAATNTHKFNRKRIQSQTSGSAGGKFHPPHKKRRSQTSILPTKFLLGGNICDPLNLSSFQDEDINRAMNAVTPKSSPLPTPKHRKGEIEVIIPPNINDPLNLNSCENDEEYVAQLAKTSPVKKPRGKSKRKRKRINSSSQSKEEVVEGSACGEAAAPPEPPSAAPAPAEVEATTAAAAVPAPPEPVASRLTVDLHLNLEPAVHEAAVTSLESPTKKSQWQRRSDEAVKDRRTRKLDLKDKIVSPVIWQPGQKPLHPRLRHKTGKTEAKEQIPPKFNPKSAAFQYGNYNRYYGYRNSLHAPDVRLKCFTNFPELFKDKDVLDIGCNIGHITLSVGRDFRARSVIGIDIDRNLINIARKNVQHYVNYEQSPATRSTPNRAADEQMSDDKRLASEAQPHERFFPISMPIVFGPVDIPGITEGMGSKTPSAPKPFPRNVSFVQGNYVLESDALLALEKPQFDVILCLSMTKWIHLNWGDAGLKRAFRRMFAQLRPGGKLILESQGWPSYKRKKNLTESIWTNFKAISLFPHQFRSYLLSPEVGFSKYQILDVPHHSAKGFCRPIIMYFKAEEENDKPNSPNVNLERTKGDGCLPSGDSPESTAVSSSESSVKTVISNPCESKAETAGTSSEIREVSVGSAATVAPAGVETRGIGAENVRASPAELRETSAETVIVETRGTEAKEVRASSSELREASAETVESTGVETRGTEAENVGASPAELRETSAETVIVETRGTEAKEVRASSSELCEASAETVESTGVETRGTEAENVRASPSELCDTDVEMGEAVSETRTEHGENVETPSCDSSSDRLVSMTEQKCEPSCAMIDSTSMEVEDNAACFNPVSDSVLETVCVQSEAVVEPHRTEESGVDDSGAPPPPRLDKTDS